MTDRELLEKAAKAAGIAWDRDSEVWYATGDAAHVRFDWNPLTDDGDALRLAVKLGLVVSIDIELGGETEAWPYAHMGCLVDEAHHESEPYAATRRAIVRAAAAIGEGV